VEFDFRVTGSYHWILVWYTYQTQLVVNSGNFIARESYNNKNIHVAGCSSDRWYHIKIYYNSSTRKNTIWVDDVEQLTWNEDRYWNRVFVGDVFSTANHGEAFWDNFHLRYYNAPDKPILISPENNASFDLTPGMEWEFSDPSPGDHQTAYHLQIADEQTFASPFLDTDIVDEGNSTFDPPHLSFGVWYWRVRVRDNETLWSEWSDPFNFTINNTNKPPVWGLLPVLEAIEDVPFTYDFSLNISDIDDPLHNLTLSGSSPYITNIEGFNVTFLFPNGMTQATIPLVIRDPWRSNATEVRFIIHPVNDPPTHSIPLDHFAEEDIPLVIDVTPWVSDIDNPLTELLLEVDDPFAQVNGLELTVTFPNGILVYELWINVSDGQARALARLTFTIMPINDPPAIHGLGNFTAIEDQVSVLNLTPYLNDVDNPVEDLSVLARSDNCTVDGQELRFFYSLGDVEETVTIEVNDGRAITRTQLHVQVEERNDAPIVHTVSPEGFKEDWPEAVDLSPYIEDEDSPLDELTITCAHPSVVDISGFNITFLFTEWMPEHEVEFSVSDGYLSATGSFLVQVQAVNDRPKIIGIGELRPPLSILMKEGTELWFTILVEDEDNTDFYYSVDTLWEGVEVFPNGTLHVKAEKGEIGSYTTLLRVDDRNGGFASLPIDIEVVDVNDPPSTPLILRPVNHTIVEEGTNVTFAIDTTDPDLIHGQLITVFWTSNLTGVIMTLTSDEDLEFTTDDLPAGVHRITITVTDGEFQRVSWLELTVIEKPVPPEPRDDANFLSEPTGIATIIIAVVLATLVVAFFIVATRRRKEAETPTTTEAPSPLARDDAPPTTIEVTDAHDIGLSSLIPAHTEKLDVEIAEVPEIEVPAVEEEAPEFEPVEVEPELPSEAELQARAHSARVRDVMRVLTQLPRGLPTTLWGKDMSRLAKEIVDGPKRTTDDGTLLVEIDGHWYTADHKNIGRFLREWREDETREGPIDSAQDRARKLEQLDERLLEGKISEETYERLRKKYEG
jgi:hypothetical protein